MLHIILSGTSIFSSLIVYRKKLVSNWHALLQQVNFIINTVTYLSEMCIHISAYMNVIESLLVQVMACRLFCVKPVNEPMKILFRQLGHPQLQWNF